MNTYNTLVVKYDGTDKDYNFLELDEKSFMKISNLKKKKDHSNIKLKRTITNLTNNRNNTEMPSYKLDDELKKEIDEIIILAYNYSPPHNNKENAKDYYPEMFTDYLEKELKEIYGKTDALKEMYNKFQKNSKKTHNIAKIAIPGGILFAAYNARTNPTIQNIGLPITISILSIAGYINDKNIAKDIKKSHNLERYKYNALENTLNRIKSKKTKITLIKSKY